MLCSTTVMGESLVSDADTTVLQLRKTVAKFVHKRDWERFHDTRNIAAALSVEAAEMLELFLWKSPQGGDDAMSDPATRQQVLDEMSDIIYLCLSLANALDIDLSDAFVSKLAAIGRKYPEPNSARL